MKQIRAQMLVTSGLKHLAVCLLHSFSLLKDTVKAIAEEMDMKPASLNKAIRIAYKNEFANVQDSFSQVEEILQATGRDV